MSFQPFVVQCLTCGSQLRVTDPSIVGTIAACPKCHSMVPIERPGPMERPGPLERPGQQVAVGGSAVDSQAITEEAIAANEAAEFGSSPPTSSGFSRDEDLTDEEGRLQESGPLPPDWQSDRTRRSRQIALVIAVSVISLFVCLAGFSWFVHSWKDRQPVSQGEPDSSSQRSSQPSEDSNRQTTAASPDDAISASESDTSYPSSDSNDSPSASPKSGDPSELVDATPTERQAEESPSPMPDAPSENVGTEQPSSALPADLIPKSPLDDAAPSVPPPPAPELPQAPERQATVGGTGEQDSNPDADTTGLEELPPGLAKYTRFLLDEGPTEKPTLQAPPTMDDVNLEAAADELDDPTITVRPKEINLNADLALRMALDTKGYRLPDLVLLIGQITSVPIQIDWVSFDLANIDLDAPVTAPQGWQTAREILDATAEKLGAELRDEETLAVITLRDEVFEQQLAKLSDLSDFGAGQASAKAVLLDFLGSQRPEQDGEQDTGLPLGVSREDRQISGIAMDALRRMRDIPPKVVDEHLHRWAWPTTDATGEWLPVVGGESLPQLDAPIAMADFLRRIARKNQVTTLVNWYDFARRSIAPERLFIPHSDVDAGQTLQRALEPLGLQARQVDPAHWWLGRESTYDRLPVIVWTPPLGPQRDRFTQELTSVMEGATRDAFRLSIDPDTDRALILLPRFVVRQLSKLADGIATQ